MRRIAVIAVALGLATGAEAFTYQPAGTLVSGSGTGRSDQTVHLVGMRFPMESAPAYLNSQVYAPGGSQGGGGGQCDASNYSYPWWDNYCESRDWTMPLCPSGFGHQGQDLRGASCADDVHWVVAAENGTISHIGSYSVYLQGASGIRHRYLHMKPSSIPVSVSQRVSKGQRLGRVSDAFGGSSTTIHLHYDMYRWVSGYGSVYVTPYMSLVRSYETLLGLGPSESNPAACTPGTVAGAENELFKDMPPGTLAKAEAEALYRAGVTHGCSQDPLLFCPDCPTTRYMMVVLLVNAAGIDVTNAPTSPSFTDVPRSAWYYPWVEAARAAGITQGCGDGSTFCPSDVVTRGMGAAFIVNTMNWVVVSPPTPTFGDVPTSAWYYASVETLSDHCVTNGCGSGNFCPDDTLTRRQAAAFIARAFDLENTNACVEYCDPATCDDGSGCEEEWTECSGFSDACDTTGTQTRACNDFACTGSAKVQSCQATPRSESRACTRTVSCQGDGGSSTSPDAGPGGGDAGTGVPDAGPRPDAGGGRPITASGGCGCDAGASGGAAGGWTLLLLAAVARSRSRRLR